MKKRFFCVVAMLLMANVSIFTLQSCNKDEVKHVTPPTPQVSKESQAFVDAIGKSTRAYMESMVKSGGDEAMSEEVMKYTLATTMEKAIPGFQDRVLALEEDIRINFRTKSGGFSVENMMPEHLAPYVSKIEELFSADNLAPFTYTEHGEEMTDVESYTIFLEKGMDAIYSNFLSSNPSQEDLEVMNLVFLTTKAQLSEIKTMGDAATKLFGFKTNPFKRILAVVILPVAGILAGVYAGSVGGLPGAIAGGIAGGALGLYIGLCHDFTNPRMFDFINDPCPSYRVP